MKILWLIDQQLDTSLSSNKWREIIKYLQKKYSVTFFGRYKYKKIQIGQIKNALHYFKSTKIPYLSRLVFYMDQLRKYEPIINDYFPDFVLFNTQNFFITRKAVKLKKKYNHRLILDIRSLVVSPNKIGKLINEFLFRNTIKTAASYFDGITYITEEMEHYCKKKYNLPEHVSCIWSSGVNTNLFRPTYQIINDNNHILSLIYHGSVNSNRSIQNVVKALSIIRSKNIFFSILGAGDGIDKIEKLIKESGLSKTIKILKSVPYEEIPSIINSHNIGILPFAKWPGWNTSSPIKLFEYLACGIPVIATRISAHLNVLKDKNFVIWADSDNPQDIAKAIIQAYEKHEQFASFGREARKFVVNNYTWEKQLQKLDLFLQSI